MKNNTEIGVVISRFQVDDLHEGHTHLLKQVLDEHVQILILLGVSNVKLSKRNSLDFQTRKLMMEEFMMLNGILPVRYKILPIQDNPRRNDLWSKNVDKTIFESMGKLAILYGSRDSFIRCYEGIHPTIEVPHLPNSVSGTEVREIIAQNPLGTSDFRKGCIYQAYNKYPIIYCVVDVAIMNSDRTMLLLGRKSNDHISENRFIGGFVDIKDENELVTVRREASEETGGCEIEPGEFICSAMIREDPRYKNEPDQMLMTHFYAATFVYGNPRGTDDLSEVNWFVIDDLTEEMFVPEHKKLFIQLKNHLNKHDLHRSTV